MNPEQKINFQLSGFLTARDCCASFGESFEKQHRWIIFLITSQTLCLMKTRCIIEAGWLNRGVPIKTSAGKDSLWQIRQIMG